MMAAQFACACGIFEMAPDADIRLRMMNLAQALELCLQEADALELDFVGINLTNAIDSVEKALHSTSLHSGDDLDPMAS